MMPKLLFAVILPVALIFNLASIDVQAALNAGGTVYLPAGVYTIPTTLTATIANTVIAGDGIGQTRLQWNGTRGLVVAANDVIVRDLTLDGGWVPPGDGYQEYGFAGQNGIYVKPQNRVQLLNVEVTRFKDDAVVFNGQQKLDVNTSVTFPSFSRIDRLWVHDNGGKGIALWWVNDVTILDSLTDHNGLANWNPDIQGSIGGFYSHSSETLRYIGNSSWNHKNGYGFWMSGGSGSTLTASTTKNNRGAMRFNDARDAVSVGLISIKDLAGVAVERSGTTTNILDIGTVRIP